MKKILFFAFLMVFMFALTVSAIAEGYDNEHDSQSTIFEFEIFLNNDIEMESTEQESTDNTDIVQDEEASESESAIQNNTSTEAEYIVQEEENDEEIAGKEEICQNDELAEDDIEQAGSEDYMLANGDCYDATVIVARASVEVNRISESHSELVIVITHEYLDKTVIAIEETFVINKNAADRYNVGEYIIYVDIKGGNMIRACYIVR
jgi:hypothetical protein